MEISSSQDNSSSWWIPFPEPAPGLEGDINSGIRQEGGNYLLLLQFLAEPSDIAPLLFMPPKQPETAGAMGGGAKG